ncbi:MAG: hypothetical protein HYZ75_07555 [Elusimicrobia bacterium]|nr:hypothetical protein [Elusimicrobiota bacterium]
MIEETVEAELDGVEPRDPVETFHFAWSGKHYAGKPGAVAAGFARHAGRLRARFRERLFSAIGAFAKALDKKLG